MQTILSRRASLAVVAAGILIAAMLLVLAGSARAVVPGENAASARDDGSMNAASTEDDDSIMKDPGAAPGREFAPGQVIVKFKENAGPGARANVRSQVGLEKEKELGLIKAEVAKVEGRSVEDAVQALERRPEVQYAQPNFKYYAAIPTDEPYWSQLWGMHNTGQSGGTPNVDINLLEASGVTQGNTNLVVAVIDSGVDFSHPDLASREWVNPDETPNNGIDDDGNGYIDDVNGWDFVSNDKTVFDPGEHFHGTHVSGTVAASDNTQGVIGVAPNVKIMSLKFLDSTASGWTDDAIEAITYAKAEGAMISNNSWGGVGYDQALYDAIKNSGSLFVAAAGNGGADQIGDNNDVTQTYPASYDLSNILAVAAVNNQGNLASFSNYGATSVDISAPGVSILSTLPNNSYGSYNGTSMATPHATGAAALVASVEPTLLANPEGLKARIMDTGKPLPATTGKTVTGDMVDALKAVDPNADTTAPNTSIDTGPSGPTSDDTPTFTFSGTDDVTPAAGLVFSYKVDGDNWSAPSSATSVTLPVQSQGSHTFYVRAQDEAGLVDPSAAERSFTVDSLAPAAPSKPDLAAGSDSGASNTDNLTNDITPTFTGTAEAGSTVKLFVDGVQKGSATASTGGTYSITTTQLAQGAHSVSATATDRAGNVSVRSSSLTVTVHTGRPWVSGVVPAPGATGVWRGTNVVATFSEPMQGASVTSAFKLYKAGATTPISATVSYDAVSRKATLNPYGASTTLLASKTKYKAVVTTAVKDLAGNTMATQKVWYFTTRS